MVFHVLFGKGKGKKKDKEGKKYGKRSTKKDLGDRPYLSHVFQIVLYQVYPGKSYQTHSQPRR